MAAAFLLFSADWSHASRRNLSSAISLSLKSSVSLNVGSIWVSSDSGISELTDPVDGTFSTVAEGCVGISPQAVGDRGRVAVFINE